MIGALNFHLSLLKLQLSLLINQDAADVLRMKTLNLKLDIGVDVGVGFNKALMTALQQFDKSLARVCSSKFNVDAKAVSKSAVWCPFANFFCEFCLKAE